jgi:hypothetical protein
VWLDEGAAGDVLRDFARANLHTKSARERDTNGDGSPLKKKGKRKEEEEEKGFTPV